MWRQIHDSSLGRATRGQSGAAVRIAVLSVVATGLVAFAGCGPRSDRLEVSGEVTLDGVPLDSGSIRFNSLEGQRLVASGAMIRDGEYFVPEDKGLWPGTYRVEISSPDVNAPPVMMRDPEGGPSTPVAPERIPTEYNVNSRQTIEVTAEGENHFPFDIVSKTP